MCMSVIYGRKNNTMKKIFLLICIVTLSGVEACFSQEESKQFIHKGLMRAQGTISPGIMLKENITTISLHGTLEYYIADNISIRGDSYYFLKDNNTYDPSFAYNNSTFAGASYHFKTKNHFDPYFAFEPGIAIAQSMYNYAHIHNIPSDTPPTYFSRAINPLISSAIGFNFYFQKIFHLFGEARYICGKHLSDAPTPLSLNELRFSFGLGINISVIKPKN